MSKDTFQVGEINEAILKATVKITPSNDNENSEHKQKKQAIKSNNIKLKYVLASAAAALAVNQAPVIMNNAQGCGSFASAISTALIKGEEDQTVLSLLNNAADRESLCSAISNRLLGNVASNAGDIEKKRYRYTNAAEQGDSYAQFSLAQIYEYIDKDNKKAAFWYEKALKNGIEEAQWGLERTQISK